jgi:hypothetical protein
MPKASALRSYLAEFVVVFVGVALAFAVDNLREARNDRAVGDQYSSSSKVGPTIRRSSSKLTGRCYGS